MNRITQLSPVRATRKTKQLLQLKTKLTRPTKAEVRKINALLRLVRSIIVRRKLNNADLNKARASGLTDGEIVEAVANLVLVMFSNHA
jgi:hypothetical protein